MTQLTLRRTVALVLTGAAPLLVVHACTPPLTPEDVKLRPTSLLAVSNGTMNVTVGTTVQNQPVVRVLDQYQEGLPGVNVTFSASSSSQPTPATVATSEQGTAAPTSWTAPTTAGTATITASVPGSTLGQRQFTVTLDPGPAAQAAVAPTTPSSNNQSAAAGSAVPVAPQVKVTDQYGNAVSGVAVTFAVTGGGGVVVPTTAVTTDAGGIAKPTSWTLGPTVGTNTLRATVAGIATAVNFTATGVPGAPASIVIAPGSPTSQGQTAIAGSTVPVAPAVLVRDANNNVTPNVTVRFTVASGGGKVLSSSSDATGSNALDVTTNTSGIATVFGWRLGSPGGNTLSVTIPSTSVPAFTITATATVGAPSQIQVSNAAWAYTRQSTNHLGTPKVVVRDASGNAIAGATINWTAGANATVSGTTSSTTGSDGIATFPGTWTAGATAGVNMQLVATVASAPSLTATFTSLIVGAPAFLSISAGNNQSAPASTNVSIEPAVLVRDASNNPVPGASVSFSVTSGGGSVTGSPAPADSVGVATVGSWRLGSTTGTNTLVAFISGTSLQVTFTATATGCPSTTYGVGQTVNGTVATTDCVTGSPAAYFDRYGFTPATQQYFAMIVTAGSTGIKYTEWFWANNSAGITWTLAAGAQDTIYNILKAGEPYEFHLRGDPAGSTGTYTFTSQANPTPPATACYFYVTKGISISHSLSSSSCLMKSKDDQTATNRSFRSYGLYLEANTTLTVRMAGTLDNYIEIYDFAGNFIASRDAAIAGGTEVLTLPSSTSGRFLDIRATHYLSSSTDTPKTGTFTLTIDP